MISKNASQKRGSSPRSRSDPISYRFQVSQNKMMILSISDYDENNQRLYFAEVYKWQDIEPGSQHEAARKIAIQWIGE